MISPETIAQIRALMEEASVFEEDLDESFILGGGPGGQKTNKTSNVVRLSHEPSALSVRCGETRSRETNRWLARRMLAELILEREKLVIHLVVLVVCDDLSAVGVVSARGLIETLHELVYSVLLAFIIHGSPIPF